MRKTLRDNGLLIVNLALFAIFLIGMSLAGVRDYNADQMEHQQAAVSFWHYLSSGAFIESVFENWESEFLQMGSYVVLTAYFIQRGSAESKPVDQRATQDADPRDADRRKDVPWPVRKGGFVLRLYENSLALFFAVLFFLSVWLHAVGGAKAYSEEQVAHGQSAVSTGEYLLTSRFWFESFQNWQSEFLAVACIVGATVYLRQRGSAESKPVDAPHTYTGA